VGTGLTPPEEEEEVSRRSDALQVEWKALLVAEAARAGGPPDYFSILTTPERPSRSQIAKALSAYTHHEINRLRNSLRNHCNRYLKQPTRNGTFSFESRSRDQILRELVDSLPYLSTENLYGIENYCLFGKEHSKRELPIITGKTVASWLCFSLARTAANEQNKVLERGAVPARVHRNQRTSAPIGIELFGGYEVIGFGE